MGTVIEQMDRHEYRLKKCEDRIDDIKSILKLNRSITDQKRDELITEEKELQQAATNHKKSLATLRGENRKSMLLSVALLAVIVLVYFLLTSNNFT